jgi:hypothetical protein
MYQKEVIWDAFFGPEINWITRIALFIHIKSPNSTTNSEFHNSELNKSYLNICCSLLKIEKKYVYHPCKFLKI